MSSYSLPSFAQAFDSLDDRDRNSLPPIHSISHSQSPYLRHDARHDSRGQPPPPPLQKRESRKRQLERDESSEPSSPRIVKQEQDVDQLEPSPPPPPPAKPQKVRQQLYLNTNLGSTSTTNNAAANAAGSITTSTNSNASNNTTTNANTHVAPPPLPSLTRQAPPPSKRRRVTISGVAHPTMHNPSLYGTVDGAHTPPPHSTNTGPSTPISPVVMGFTIQRDPQAVEQVRAMLAVKQKQKALIESRRGSAAGLAGPEGGRRGSNAGIVGAGEVAGRRASVAAPSVTVNVVNPTPTTATGPGPGPSPAPPLRRTGSSPNGHRLVPTPPTMSPNARANAARTRSPSLLGGARNVSPSPRVVPSHTQNQSQSQSQNQNQNTRAPPPPPSSSSTHTNLSPPSHQTHPNAAPNRPHMPSPPQPTTAPPPSSSNPQQSQSHQSQSQAPPPPFVASQGLSALANNLPPPPNSFTRRRAGQLGLRNNKPADLMISPRESESGSVPGNNNNNKPLGSALQNQSQAHSSLQRGIVQLPSVPVSNSYKMLQPSIQSAPPRPGQQPGRFPMALPSLPPVIGAAGGAAQRGTSMRKTTGQVPPTPTRLSMQRAMGTAESASVRLSQPTGLPRVPRTATAASFATPHGPAGVTMPATPATLHRASGADKAAFLAPFEQFYDALSDAQVLKGWFSEQLRRVGTLAKDGEAQVARLRATDGGLSRSEVESLVREAVLQEARGWREEVGHLRAQVADLQDELHDLRTGESRYETKGRNITGRTVNGLSPRPPFQPPPQSSNANANAYPTAPGVDTYTFPPVQRPQPPPPASASSTSTGMHAPPPSSGTRRSPSPKRVAHEAMSERESTSVSVSGREESGYASVSGTSSPAPEVESGIGRRVSVSAMRFEPQQPQQRRDAPTPGAGEKGREREQEKGRGRGGRPGSKKAGSHTGGGGGGGGGGGAAAGSKAQAAGGESGDAAPARRATGDGGPPASGAPKRPSSPMDET